MLEASLGDSAPVDRQDLRVVVMTVLTGTRFVTPPRGNRHSLSPPRLTAGPMTTPPMIQASFLLAHPRRTAFRRACG